MNKETKEFLILRATEDAIAFDEMEIDDETLLAHLFSRITAFAIIRNYSLKKIKDFFIIGIDRQIKDREAKEGTDK
jgi:hypothetical protein